MLTTNISSCTSLRLLVDSVKERKKPLIFWVGAGASAWCGYPTWDKLAEFLHSKYLKYEPAYDRKEGLGLLQSNRFPDFFQLCRDINEKNFFSTLAATFLPKAKTPVYERFINEIRSITPVYIVTTNVDECLENSVSDIAVVQNTDIDRCISLIHDKQSFICKLHGSISSVKSMIFTTNDYSHLMKDEKYEFVMRQLFSTAMILFIGYGLGDQYVLDLLSKNEKLGNIFADGPHFAIMSINKSNLPESIKIINYEPILHKDHRSAIQVISEVTYAHKLQHEDGAPMFNAAIPSKIISAHLISDIFPPGTWKSSYTLSLTEENGHTCTAIIGNGFVESELPFTNSTAMHDLIVGLLCFETVYAPLSTLSRLHHLLGSELFWYLVGEGCLKFIDWKTQVGMIYPDDNAIRGGDLGSFCVFNSDFTEKTIPQIIRHHIQPIDGKEASAEKLFELLEKETIVIEKSMEPSISDLTRGLLLRPSIRALLGMSGGTPLNSIPRWLVYPVLRLANIIKIGTTCQLLGIASTKLECGAASLASPAFAAASGQLTADNMASYVIHGRFDTNIGAAAVDNPAILKTVVDFRNTSAGASLRKEILSQLSLSAASDFIASVDGAMKSIVPLKSLQAAHDQFAGLLLCNNTSLGLTPAVWNNDEYASKALSLWKKRSEKELAKYCAKEKIDLYDLCPCGSGDKLKFCCYEALKVSVF